MYSCRVSSQKKRPFSNHRIVLRALPSADGVRVLRNARIETRDGLRLAADIYQPEEAEAALPVVLEYIPYRKDDAVPRTRFYEYLVERGYIVARVDIRGTGA